MSEGTRITMDEDVCGNSRIVLLIDRRDQIRAHFDEIDHALLRECDGSSSVADKLLGLELIVRRIEQARPSSTSVGGDSPTEEVP